MALRTLAAISLLLSLFSLFSHASPYRSLSSLSLAGRSLSLRDDPVFPNNPPSCPICGQDYASISSCAQAAPVLANFTMIIFNPGAFVDIIKCACTDTFQSVYPQCVDCFIQTNQTRFLDPNDGQALPSIVDGMRKICALESTLLGGVATADGEATPTSSSRVSKPTGTSAASSNRHSLLALGSMVIPPLALIIVFGLVDDFRAV